MGYVVNSIALFKLRILSYSSRFGWSYSHRFNDTRVIDEYKGEARFLRALAHHELLKHFCRPYSDNPTAAKGGVPYRTVPITGSTAADAEAVKG